MPSRSNGFTLIQVLVSHLIKKATLLLLAFWSLPASGSTIISVGDGDTIRISDGSEKLTVRLACIDAPEISQDPYGKRSRDFLRNMLPIGTKVTLRIQAIDRYGRSVAEVFTKRGNINESIIEQGHGFVYRRYLSKCNGSRYLSLERQAQKLGLGVWSTSPTGIQRPWDYRKNKHSANSNSRRKYRCKEIVSWSKAQQLLKEGHTYLDRDRDGEACETLR